MLARPISGEYTHPSCHAAPHFPGSARKTPPVRDRYATTTRFPQMRSAATIEIGTRSRESEAKTLNGCPTLPGSVIREART